MIVRQKPGGQKTVSPGRGRAFALMNSQQHGSPHKVKPVNLPAWVEKKLLMLTLKWKLFVAEGWRGGGVSFLQGFGPW